MAVRFGARKKRKKITGYKQYKSFGIVSGEKVVSSKKIKFSFNTLKYIFYSLVIISIAYYFFISDKFIIKDVLIEGNHMVTQEEILSKVPIGSNIFLFNSKQKRNDLLSEYQEFKDVQIYKGFPNAIKIVITEYEGQLIWQTNEKRYLINPQGKIIRLMSADENIDLPTIVDKKNILVDVGDRVVSASFIVFVQNIRNNFFKETNVKPTIFEVNDTTFDINLLTEAGFYVKLDTTRASAKQLESIKSILVAKRADIKEYIDVRVDGWAYYK